MISYRGCNRCLSCGRVIKYDMGMEYHNPLPCESCGDKNPRRLPNPKRWWLSQNGQNFREVKNERSKTNNK